MDLQRREMVLQACGTVLQAYEMVPPSSRSYGVICQTVWSIAAYQLGATETTWTDLGKDLSPPFVDNAHRFLRALPRSAATIYDGVQST